MNVEVRNFQVVEAGLEHVPAIAGVLSRAAGWRQATHGFNDWPIPFPPEQVEESLVKARVFAGKMAGEVVATMTLSEEDVPIWGEQPTDAFYISKLAVDPDHHGLGLGRLLLAGADDIARLTGKSLLRLECNNLNHGLRSYYMFMGFRNRGIKPLCYPDDRPCYTAARFERRALA